MTKTALISVLCPDRVGVVAAMTGQIFDLGGNLGDTKFRRSRRRLRVHVHL